MSMAWNVSWEDSRGRHDVSYKNMNSVLEHVDYCLKNGWSIYSIRTVLGEGQKGQCIFPQKYRKNTGKILDDEILAALKEHGQMSVLEIAEKTSCSCRTDSLRRTTIRTRMYALRDKGLVVSVPNWENESIWRLVV